MHDVPCRVDTRGFSLIQPWDLASLVESHYQCTDTEWPDTTGLSVPLLHASNVFRDVIDRYRVFHRESVRLCFKTGLVDKDSSIGVQTGEGKANVVVEKLDLRGCNASVLKLHR